MAHVPNSFKRWFNAMVGIAGLSTTAYVDSAVSGLYDDRGNYDASGNMFPASGGSGAAGVLKKGDIWTISVAGTLGGEPVRVGDNVRALVDTPGQTAGNWSIVHAGVAGAVVRTDIPYDFAFQVDGKPSAGLVVFRAVAARAFTLGATGHVGKAATAANAQADFLVKVNNTTKDTLRFAASGTSCSIVGGTQTAIAVGDVITVIAPASQDSTLADIGFTLWGSLL